MEKVDITIIGAGAVGLACAYELSGKGKDVMVVEKNESFGRETSSRNSEVVHAGLHYKKGSLKTELCLQGNKLIYEYCSANNIKASRTGKYTVAYDEESRAKIEQVFEHAKDCGIDNVRMVSGAELKSVEPFISAKQALYSGDSGIFDTHSFMSSLFLKARDKGVSFVFGAEVAGIRKSGGSYVITASEPNGGIMEFESSIVLNSSGHSCEKIAALVGIDTVANGYKIHLCKGCYFRVENPSKFPVKHLIYPPPNPNALGIHIVLDLSGGIRLGPDARYVDKIDYSVDENDKKFFCASVNKFLPALEITDLIPDTAGIRPKLQGPGEGFRDFVISEESSKDLKGLINLIGIESPGLTASLAIAKKVARLI